MAVAEFPDGAGIAGHYRDLAADHRHKAALSEELELPEEQRKHLFAVNLLERAAKFEAEDPAPEGLQRLLGDGQQPDQPT